MQFSQRSQPLWTSTATRSPTRNSSTPGPRAATVPAYSWPITNCPAGWPWSVRCSTFTSVPQIDATSIFSSASPSPGSGLGQASTPTFDLQVPGRPDSSAMDYFARLGYDTWCVDMEGYGRSDKRRAINSNIANGADDLEVATDYIKRTRGVESFFTYGVSSGALRAALFAERHPERVRRLALDAFVWTGRGSPTLADRRKRLPEYESKNRRPIDQAFVRSIFTRDHPGTADDEVVAAFADAILALDDSVPTGTYVDMCANLPVVDPARITIPTLILRGEYDGIASVEDLVEFFARLPNPDKQF